MLLAALTVHATAQTGDAAAERPPNVVVLFSDDAGWADFGFMPHAAADLKALTPNIDRIAKEGMTCTQAYMSGVVCSPSRAGLLTGRYQQRFGHENNIPPGYMKGGMDLAQTTIADHLGAAGHATGLIGKWHLGYPGDYHPNERGFDEFYGLLQGSRPYHVMPEPTAHRVLQHNGEALPEEGYVTDRLGTFACEFIEAHKKEPFFLLVSFTAPHGPLQPRHDDEAFLDGLGIDKPQRRKFAGLIHALDQNVGRILAALDAHGLTDDTLVVFTNDNGGQTQVGADNGPLRGRKGMVYEGGSRVPWAMRWPGVIEAGTTCEAPIISLDLLPTFAALAGRSLEGSDHDGVDLGPLIRGQVATLPDRPLFWRVHGSEGDIAMREGNWKLVWRRSDGAAPELYDLATDLGEAHDLAGEQPDRVRAMQQVLAAWEAELVEPRW